MRKNKKKWFRRKKYSLSGERYQLDVLQPTYLQEATRPHVPLLERMAFLGIYSNNLDEFFRVRMATQSRIAECTDKAAAKESEHARKLIRQIGKLNARYVEDYEKTVASVTEALRQENIYLVNDAEVTPEQLAFIQKFYREN